MDSTIGALPNSECTRGAWSRFVAAAVAASSVNAVSKAYQTDNAAGDYRNRVRLDMSGRVPAGKKGPRLPRCDTAWRIGERLRTVVGPNYPGLGWACGPVAIAATRDFDVLARTLDALAHLDENNCAVAAILAVLAVDVADAELGFVVEDDLRLARDVVAAAVHGAGDAFREAHSLAMRRHRPRAWRLEMATRFNRAFVEVGVTPEPSWTHRLPSGLSKSETERIVRARQLRESVDRMAEARRHFDLWALSARPDIAEALGPLIRDERRHAAWADQVPRKWTLESHPYLSNIIRDERRQAAWTPDEAPRNISAATSSQVHDAILSRIRTAVAQSPKETLRGE